MSKVTEYTLALANVAIGGTKSKTYFAKHYAKLMRALPKEVKRKWQTITYLKDGVEIVINRDER